jgi:hypothetical protein
MATTVFKIFFFSIKNPHTRCSLKDSYCFCFSEEYGEKESIENAFYEITYISGAIE